MSAPTTFLAIESVVFALLGITNLLLTRWRLNYVLNDDNPASALDVFWQRDIAVFQVGAAVVGLSALGAGAPAQQAALAGLGTIWLLGSCLTGHTAVFNDALRSVVTKPAGLGISFISLVLAAGNGWAWASL